MSNTLTAPSLFKSASSHCTFVNSTFLTRYLWSKTTSATDILLSLFTSPIGLTVTVVVGGTVVVFVVVTGLVVVTAVALEVVVTFVVVVTGLVVVFVVVIVVTGFSTLFYNIINGMLVLRYFSNKVTLYSVKSQYRLQN